MEVEISLNRDDYTSLSKEQLQESITQFITSEHTSKGVTTVFIQCSIQEISGELSDALYAVQKIFPRLRLIANVNSDNRCFNYNNFFYLQIHESQYCILHIFPECLCYLQQIKDQRVLEKYYVVFLRDHGGLVVQPAQHRISFDKQLISSISGSKLFNYHLFSGNYLHEHALADDERVIRFTYDSYLAQRNTSMRVRYSSFESLRVGFLIDHNPEILDGLQDLVVWLREGCNIVFKEVQYIYIPINSLNEPKVLNFEDTVDVFVIVTGCMRCNLLNEEVHKQCRNIVNLFEFAVQLEIVEYRVDNYEIDAPKLLQELRANNMLTEPIPVCSQRELP